jgi:hypothetical protein
LAFDTTSGEGVLLVPAGIIQEVTRTLRLTPVAVGYLKYLQSLNH